MSTLPRLAIGTVQQAANPTPMLWGLVDVLKRSGRQVQIFDDQACFAPGNGDRDVCGQSSRYLDSWLMSPELCRESFAYGTSGSDIALVHGRYAGGRGGAWQGGCLEDLCNWLDLPQLVILDAEQLGDCRLPARPCGADGILLDRVERSCFHRVQTSLESLWGIPVLGCLPEAAALRRQIDVRPADCVTPCELCPILGELLLRTLDLEKVLRLASQHEFFPAEPRVFRRREKLAGLTIAVAYDEAIQRYFPDVLDLLELQGASVQDFSPLHDDALPEATDIVYLGCGRPDLFARQLAGNHCMALALRNHVSQGRRIYAEGGGLAYLCQQMRLPGGEQVAMTGVLPAIAEFRDNCEPPHGCQIVLGRDHWLGPAGSVMRGYLNRSWQIKPSAECTSLERNPGAGRLIARHRAVGSRMHINFAAQPDFLRRFSSAYASAAC